MFSTKLLAYPVFSHRNLSKRYITSKKGWYSLRFLVWGNFHTLCLIIYKIIFTIFIITLRNPNYVCNIPSLVAQIWIQSGMFSFQGNWSNPFDKRFSNSLYFQTVIKQSVSILTISFTNRTWLIKEINLSKILAICSKLFFARCHLIDRFINCLILRFPEIQISFEIIYVSCLMNFECRIKNYIIFMFIFQVWSDEGP